MEVEDGLEQRTYVIRIHPVRIRTGLDQQLRALEASGARGVQQGREATGRTGLHARLGRDLARPVIHQRALIHDGAVLEEHADHGRLLLGGGPHQRRLIAPLLVCIDVGAMADQQLRSLDIAGPRENHQRRLAIGIGGFDVGAGGQQRAQRS